MAKFKNPPKVEYIAGEQYDYMYTSKQLSTVKKMYVDNPNLKEIAKAVNKRPIEIFICIASLIDDNKLPNKSVDVSFYK